MRQPRRARDAERGPAEQRHQLFDFGGEDIRRGTSAAGRDRATKIRLGATARNDNAKRRKRVAQTAREGNKGFRRPPLGVMARAGHEDD